MDKSKIIAFAKENGYDGIQPLGKWRGYDAYEPTFDKATGEEPALVGPPLLILVKGDKVRMSTVEEAFAQMDETPDDDEIDDIEEV